MSVVLGLGLGFFLCSWSWPWPRALCPQLHLCLLQLNGTTQKKVYKFKYLGVEFTSDGRQDEELDIRIGQASAIMRALHYSVVKRELSKKSKALNFRNSLCPFFPTVSLYGHENSMMTERVRSKEQAFTMRILNKIQRVTLLTRSTSLEIRKSLEQLLLQMERSHLRWFGHVSKKPQEKLPKKLYLPKLVGKTQLDNLELL